MIRPHSTGGRRGPKERSGAPRSVSTTAGSRTVSVPSSNARPCPSTPEQEGAPSLDFDISAITVASTQGTHGKSFSSADSKRAALDKYKREKERENREEEYAEASALIALAELDYAQKTPSTSETKKKEITKLTREIEELVIFNEIVPLVVELQQKVDARQRLLDNACIPNSEQSAEINALWRSLEGLLNLNGVAAPSGDLGQSLELAASTSVPDLGSTLTHVKDFEKLKIGQDQNRNDAEKLESLMAEQMDMLNRLNFLKNALELHGLLEK